VVIELPLGVMYMIVLVMFMVSSQSTRRQKLISGLVVSGLSIILFYLAPVFVLLMGGHP
jgi:ABC-type antimicrobial peptide transport system permease subunit